VVRPIAVGEVIRRLISRACCASLKADQFFLDMGQVGVGVRGGAEAALQAVRLAIRDDNVILTGDFENAFNAANRLPILMEVEEHFPQVAAWFRFCYANPAILTCQGKVLPFGSSRGVQQGDNPLGPFFFAFSLHSCCQRLNCPLSESLSVWYLDDFMVVGPVVEVLRAWDIINEEAAKVGLKVNASKCELFDSSDATNLSVFPSSLVRCTREGFDLLGSPIGSKDGCTHYVKSKLVDRIAKALNRLHLIDDPQLEYTLLRSCLTMPSFAFALHSAPCSGIGEAVDAFDALIEATWDDRFGLYLSPSQWQQLALPIRLGGSGIHLASDIMNAAFLGATVASTPVVKALLGTDISLGAIPGAVQSFAPLKAQLGTEDHLPPSVADLLAFLSLSDNSSRRHPQHLLSDLVHKTNLAKLLAIPHSQRDQLRLAAASRPRAGLWLTALPVKQLGLKLDKQEFSILLRWWLGLPVCLQEICPEPKCTVLLDKWGDHAVSCPCGPSRIARHDAVNHVWSLFLKSCGFHVTKEVHCDPDSQRRSADTLVDSWMYGRQCAHDWVITHTLQKSILAQGTPDPAAPLAKAKADPLASLTCKSFGRIEPTKFFDSGYGSSSDMIEERK